MQSDKNFEEAIREDLDYLNNEDDELQASLDLDLFDKKMKGKQLQTKYQPLSQNRDTKKVKEEVKKNIDDMKDIEQTFKEMIQNKQKQPQAKQVSKVDEITHQIVSKKCTKKQADKQVMSQTMTNFKSTKAKDQDINVILLSKDANLKNSTIKDLINQNKILQTQLEKEKSRNQNLEITIQKLTEELGKLALGQSTQKKIGKQTFAASKKK